jgi:hypothetical protein
MVILAIGIAARLVLRPPAEVAVPAAVPVAIPQSVAPPPDRPDVVVRDYVIFAEARTTVAGTEYSIQAGHRFESEHAASFREAWCYTKRFVDGIEVNLSLGDLNAGGDPVPALPVLSEGSRKAMALSETDLGTLFRHCPWLEVGRSR